MTVSIASKTEVLIQALPYIQQYEQKTFVIKYGGAAMVDEDLKEAFAQDVTVLKKIGVRIVIVHGGGKEVTELADRLGLATRFVDGQRFTDDAMMDTVQMVLAGKTNKEIVARINRHDGDAVGMAGMDAGLLHVRKQQHDGVDLGRVGEIRQVNVKFLEMLFQQGYLPVIAPVGVDDGWESYNINADIAAGAVAAALKAEKLVYLSDVEGVLSDGALLQTLGRHQAEDLTRSGVINKGMIPKIRSAFSALDAGVEKVHLIDGRVKHSMLLEIFTDEGVGTQVIHDDDVRTVTPLPTTA